MPGLSVSIASSFESAFEGDGSQAPAVTREEWDALLHHTGCDVVFLTWQWQSLWWRHFGQEEGCKLHLLSVRDGEGALVGIAPLFVGPAPLPPLKEYRRGELRPEGEGPPVRTATFVGGKDIADYLDVIAAPGKVREVWELALDYLLLIRDEWDVISLHSLPEFTRSRELLGPLSQARGLEMRIFPEDVSPVLELPGDWETYLMGLRKKDRHELRRKVRKLESRDDAHWWLVPSRDRGALHDAIETFLALHRMSGADKAEFMDDRMAGFFRAMAAELAETGWLDLSILSIDGQPASAYLSFLYGGRLHLYNSGYSKRFASYSAGVALLAYRIHKAILQGVNIFDFLRGDEPYKYDFGARDTFVWRAFARAAAEGQRD